MASRSRKTKAVPNRFKSRPPKDVRLAFPASELKAAAVVSALLVAAALAVYWQSFGHEFTNVDDVEYVTGNRMVLRGLTLRGIQWAFTSFHAANWHPLTWVSHMLDVQMFGLWPGGHHLTSILLHIANSVMLLAVLRLFTGSLWRSVFAAGLFALHPQHVESVAWVAERKDVLSTFFMMLTLVAYWLYVQRPSVGRYVIVATSFALGLTAKPMLVTLPVLLLLIDFWPLQRSRVPGVGSLVLEKLPLFAMSAVSCVVTVKAQSAVGAVRTLALAPMDERIGNAVMSCAIYLAKTVWPTRLAQYYPRPAGGWPMGQVIGAAALLAGISYLCLRMLRRRPYLAWGWLWYLITLAPVIGIVQVGSQARADRYTYIPLIGIFVVVAYGVPDFLPRVRKRVLVAAALCTLAALGVASRVQVGYWRDAITLNKRAIAVTENNWYSYGSLGSALQSEAERLNAMGKTREARSLATQAVGYLRKCLSIAPGCGDAHDWLARALGTLDDVDGAIVHLRQAVRYRPDSCEFRSHLGMALQLKGQHQEAIAQFEEAVRLNPRYVEGHGNLALAYYRQKNYAKAWEHVHLCEEAGGRAPRDFIRKLSARMRDPGR